MTGTEDVCAHVCVCSCILGRKPPRWRRGPIGYQPPAFNKVLFRSRVVDSTSSVVRESGDKSNTDVKHTLDCLWMVFCSLNVL